MYDIYYKVGNRGYLNGESGWELIRRKSGVLYLEGDFTEEELEEGHDIVEVETYVFRKEQVSGEHRWWQYNTRIYLGDFCQYDFPDVHKYHHESEDEINPEDYLSGTYEETEDAEK